MPWHTGAVLKERDSINWKLRIENFRYVCCALLDGFAVLFLLRRITKSNTPFFPFSILNSPFFHFQFNEYPQRVNVGAYRIRPANIYVDKCVHSGVCDTPLQQIWRNADIHIQFSIFSILNLSADTLKKIPHLFLLNTFVILNYLHTFAALIEIKKKAFPIKE